MKIIVYVTDCLRADHVSCYGYPRPITPNIDALAQDGVLFERAYSPSTWTKPVATSLLTGVYPPSHGVRQRTDVMEWNGATLSQCLSEHGYASLAISTLGNVSSSIGLSRGFDRFVDLYKEPSLIGKRSFADVDHEKLYDEERGTVVFPRAEDINDVLFPYLTEYRNENALFFLWAMDPHDPYDPPEAWRTYVDTQYVGQMDGTREMTKQASRVDDWQHLINLYDGEIAYTDHCFGELIAFLKTYGLYDESMIFVLGDHGEAFGDHGHVLHGHLPYEEIIRVPLVVKFPYQTYRGTRVISLVSLLDVAPTVLGLAGVSDAGRAFFQGVNLVDAINGVSNDQRMLFTETHVSEAHNRIYSVRTDHYKYIWVQPPSHTRRLRGLANALPNLKLVSQLLRNPVFYLRRQFSTVHQYLYNVREDPAERHNLVDDRPQMAAAFRAEIQRWLEECEELRSEHKVTGEQQEIDEATIEHLRALGYID